MIKTKRIICPHCRLTHKPGEGYSFNEDLSLVCDGCNKVIMPTTAQAEVGIPKIADQRYSNNRGQGYGQQAWGEEFNIQFA